MIFYNYNALFTEAYSKKVIPVIEYTVIAVDCVADIRIGALIIETFNSRGVLINSVGHSTNN